MRLLALLVPGLRLRTRGELAQIAAVRDAGVDRLPEPERDDIAQGDICGHARRRSGRWGRKRSHRPVPGNRECKRDGRGDPPLRVAHSDGAVEKAEKREDPQASNRNDQPQAIEKTPAPAPQRAS